MKLGYKIRTGGDLPVKVFGAFGLTHEQDEDKDDETGAATVPGDVKEARAWAKKQNEQATVNGRPFTFTAYVPETDEECNTLYSQFLAMHKAPGGFLLYK